MSKNINRILEISKKHGLTHLGSCISALPMLEEIYTIKKLNDKVIMDNGHAALALYVILEQVYDKSAEDILSHHSIHPDKCEECHIDSSSGSLGHGLGISIGYVLANPDITVYCTVSDGSMMEGSNWEALRLIDSLKIKNIKIYVNANGYSAVAKIDPYFL